MDITCAHGSVPATASFLAISAAWCAATSRTVRVTSLDIQCLGCRFTGPAGWTTRIHLSLKTTGDVQSRSHRVYVPAKTSSP